MQETRPKIQLRQIIVGLAEHFPDRTRTWSNLLIRFPNFGRNSIHHQPLCDSEDQPPWKMAEIGVDCLTLTFDTSRRMEDTSMVHANR